VAPRAPARAARTTRPGGRRCWLTNETPKCVISKNTVRAKLAADAPPRYRRAATGSAVDEVEPRIRRCCRRPRPCRRR
jgi:hypothetical protein